MGVQKNILLKNFKKVKMSHCGQTTELIIHESLHLKIKPNYLKKYISPYITTVETIDFFGSFPFEGLRKNH